MRQAKLRPLDHVPASVYRTFHDERKRAKQEAFERRVRARQLLFAVGGGSMRRLSRAQNLFVRQVHEEAYQQYLHTCRTGETRFAGWKKDPEIKAMVDRAVPLRRQQHWPMWWGAQKNRYYSFDLPRLRKEANDGIAAVS